MHRLHIQPDRRVLLVGYHHAAPSQAGRFKINKSRSTELGALDQLLADGG
jgi:hypothetical protein